MGGRLIGVRLYFACRFLEFLKSHVNSCSCVIGFCLTPTEVPRKKESCGGDSFTHQQNSQQHQGQSLVVVLQAKTLFVAPLGTDKKETLCHA